MSQMPVPKPAPHFYKTNSRGLLECIDKATGRVLAVQTSPYDYLEDKFQRCVRIDTPEGPVFIERGLSFDQTKMAYTMPYSNALADLICEKVAGGMGLLDAGKEYNVEYASIVRWRRENKEFREALAQAIQDRAEADRDEALALARANKRIDPKLTVDTLKWSAEKDNPERFGQKVKHSGDPASPLTMILDTGVRRPGDPGFVEPENPIPEEKEVVLTKKADGTYDV